jgi:hypothetical protein
MTTDPVQRLTAHAVARDAWLDAAAERRWSEFSRFGEVLG